MSDKLRGLSLEALSRGRWKAIEEPKILSSSDLSDLQCPSSESVVREAPKGALRYVLGKRMSIVIPSQCEFGPDGHIYHWAIQYYKRV